MRVRLLLMVAALVGGTGSAGAAQEITLAPEHTIVFLSKAPKGYEEVSRDTAMGFRKKDGTCAYVGHAVPGMWMFEMAIDTLNCVAVDGAFRRVGPRPRVPAPTDVLFLSPPRTDESNRLQSLLFSEAHRHWRAGFVRSSDEDYWVMYVDNHLTWEFDGTNATVVEALWPSYKAVNVTAGNPMGSTSSGTVATSTVYFQAEYTATSGDPWCTTPGVLTLTVDDLTVNGNSSGGASINAIVRSRSGVCQSLALFHFYDIDNPPS